MFLILKNKKGFL